ncbi:MAG: hypothetical protein ACREMR_03585, partial [Gemmatimonadales bacterium]
MALAAALLTLRMPPPASLPLARASGSVAQQQAGPYTLHFYVPPLPSEGHKRSEPVAEWSYLDDTDSVFVVLTGTSAVDTVAAT